MVWTIRLLGGLKAERPDREITRFRTQKTGALLAYLAYHMARTHSREALIDMLWPDAPLDSGRNSLSIALSSLRHQLEPPGVPAGSVIVADRLSVGLHRASVQTDVGEFEGKLRAATHATNSVERTHLLQEAVAIYAGDLLPGHYEDWVLLEQQRLAGVFQGALRQLTTIFAAAGTMDRALDYARRAVAADPLSEPAHQELIRLLQVSGQSEAARRQFGELERILRQELHSAPAAASQATFREIPGGPVPTAGGARPSTTTDAGPDSGPPGAPTPASPLPAITGAATLLLVGLAAEEAESEQQESTGPPASPPALALRPLIEQHGGMWLRAEEQLVVAAFGRALEGGLCALSLLSSHVDALPSAPECPPIRNDPSPVPETARAPRAERLILHTCELDATDRHSLDTALQDAARVLMAAHPGQVLCTDLTAGLLRSGSAKAEPPALRLTELGTFRLRDTSQAERLFQIEDAGRAPRAFPPPRAAVPDPANLPLPFNRFFGREQELRRLTASLLPVATAPSSSVVAADAESSLGAGRVVTLTGAGGIGKTRLAIQAAFRLLEPYHGAVWFASLADVTEAALLADRIREALRLPPSPGHDPVDQITDFLAQQPALLVLDNFEHLLEDEDARPAAALTGTPAAGRGAHLVGRLIQRLPTLRCLVTSRQRLGLSCERELTVEPLAIPRDLQTAGGDVECVSPEALVLNESVRLFVDRAQAVRPYFQVTPGNAAALASLCNRLEGIPLALELAAARAQVLTPLQMLPQMERRFEFLVSRRRDTAARHRSLRAALDWSYQLLSPDMQRFLNRLSVFRGGWALEAAEHVCEDPPATRETAMDQVPALDRLAHLLECSFLAAEEQRGGMRFRMLETVRAFLAEQLPATEARDLQQRHALYCLRLAEASESALASERQREWLDRLEAEVDNLRAALAWCLETDRTLAQQLAGALWRFWMLRGYLSEGREWFHRVLEAAGRTAIPAPAHFPHREAVARAKALHGAAVLAHLQSDNQAALAMAHEAGRLYEEAGDHAQLCGLLGYTADIIDALGDPGAAAALYREALGIARRVQDAPGMAYALSGIGRLQADHEGKPEEAAVSLQESLAIYRALGDKHHTSMLLWHLGYLALGRNDPAEAERLFEEDYALSRELGNVRHIATGLCNLGTAALRRRDYERARALFSDSLSLHRRLGQTRSVAWVLENLAQVARALGHQHEASALATQSLAMRRSLNDRQGTANMLLTMAGYAVEDGDLPAAHSLSAEALEIARELDSAPLRSAALSRLEVISAAEANTASTSVDME
jgi:non-specific serine/threonine protein kinase